MRNLLILIIFVALVSAGITPECRWQCDDPICHAICRPVCQPPQCQSSCLGSTPDCWTSCIGTDGDISVADSCPYCSTKCNPLSVPGCQITCGPPQCTWTCSKPLDGCRQPSCQLVCERPTCEYQPGTPTVIPQITSLGTNLGPILGLVLVLLVAFI